MKVENRYLRSVCYACSVLQCVSIRLIYTVYSVNIYSISIRLICTVNSKKVDFRSYVFMHLEHCMSAQRILGGIFM